MSWLQLTFSVDDGLAQRLGNVLDDNGAAAVTFQDAADQPLFEPGVGETPLWNQTLVTGLFSAATDTDEVISRVSAALAPLSLPPWQCRRLEDENWERAWMENFHPMQFDRRTWICPSWHTPPQPDAVNIMLDPGLAFGTGTHATTALCLEWLDQQLQVGDIVVDYGCGSGILGIAAAKLGASAIYAVDIDPQALEATRENARRNKVSDLVQTFFPDDFPEVQADVLVANILANPLIEMAQRIARLLKPGGKLALSGILIEQSGQVLDAYTPWLTQLDCTTKED